MQDVSFWTNQGLPNSDADYNKAVSGLVDKLTCFVDGLHPSAKAIEMAGRVMNETYYKYLMDESKYMPRKKKKRIRKMLKALRNDE